MATDKEIEAAAKALCKSGMRETGDGTCSFACMDQLGDARKSCRHTVEIFGNVVRVALTAAEQVRATETQPNYGTDPTQLGVPSITD